MQMLQLKDEQCSQQSEIPSGAEAATAWSAVQTKIWDFLWRGCCNCREAPKLTKQLQQLHQSQSTFVNCSSHLPVATAAPVKISGCWLHCSPHSYSSCTEGSLLLLKKRISDFSLHSSPGSCNNRTRVYLLLLITLLTRQLQLQHQR